MKIKFFIVALTIFLGSCTHTPNSISHVCGGDVSFNSNDKVSISNISLSKKNDGPFFYLFENSYVVLMQPKDVLDSLKKNNSSKLLLEKITKDLPLKDNIDIKKYALERAFLYSAANHIAADLVANGKASIVDMGYGGNGEPLEDVSIVYLENGGDYRLICDSSKSLIFEVTDSMAEQ